MPERPVGRTRLRGLLQGLAGAAAGTAISIFVSSIAGAVVLSIAALIVVSALASPNGLYLGIERLFDLLGRLLGRGMTWLLLVPIFFLFFLPFGALLRRGRRDRLKRWFDPEADSYWEQHEGPTAGSPERARQY